MLVTVAPGQQLSLPDWFRPWPAGAKGPSSRTGDVYRPGVEDGCYVQFAPDGTLQFAAVVENGYLGTWLLLDGKGGAYCRSGYSAQRYFADGRLEDFARDDDTSRPYASHMSLTKFVSVHLDDFRPPPPPRVEFSEGDGREELPPRPDQLLSWDAPLPENLQERLERIGTIQEARVDWMHPRQACRLLVHALDWEVGLARDLCNFGPTACAAALGAGRSSFLFSRGGACQRGRLEDIPLYVKVRELAAGSPGKHLGTHWASLLARLNPVDRRYPAECRPAAVVDPIVWTLPDAQRDGFELTMDCAELLLAQEATRGGDLHRYIAGANQEEFWNAAALLGGFLQAAACTGATLPHGPRASRLFGELVTHLDDRPLLTPPRRVSPDRSLIGGAKSPPVTAASLWVHERCCGRADLSRDHEDWPYLGRFLNERGRLLRDRLEGFRAGRLIFDGPQPLGWRGADLPFDGWYDALEVRRCHELAQRSAQQLQLQAKLPGFDLANFQKRFEVARLALARATELKEQPYRSLRSQVEGWLREHKRLAAVDRVPARPGRGYCRLLAAAAWTVQEWEPGANGSDRVALAHCLLASL